MPFHTIILLLLLVVLPPLLVVIAFLNFPRLPDWAKLGAAVLAVVIVVVWLFLLT